MNDRRPISEDDLHAYVDATLESVRRIEVEAYLELHPEVAHRVDGYVRQRQALREAFAPIAEEPVPSALDLPRLIEARRRAIVPPWRFAAAAVLLLAIGGAGGWFLRGRTAAVAGAGVASLAQEAADSYEVYGPDRVRPVEIHASDTAQLVAWISQRLQHPIAVPDLAPAGYRFMGGRLVATSHGPAGLFMYDDDRGTRLIMLVRPMAIEKNMPMSNHRRGSLSGIAWSKQGIGYSLVSPASDEVLHPLADEIRRQVGDEA
ncbi:anti-sigma factor family protein [Pendulispora albinea]|uniref:Anti-sigma factor n=1 Tax=Pendulispora albinea TaxID=2741071 RepID=A0ABZ2LQN7_9BACT